MNLNNLRIRTRLSIGFGAVLVLLSAVAIVAYVQFATARNGLARMVEAQHRVELSQEWLGKTQLNVTRVIALAKASGQPDLSNHFEPLIKQTTAEINALQKSIESMSTTDESKALLATVAQRRSVYVGLRTQMFEFLKQTDQFAVDALLKDKLLPASETYMAAMSQVLKRDEADAAAVSASLGSSLQNATSMLVLLVVASLVVGVGMAYFITRSITVPLGEALNVAKVIADSDLSQHIESTRKDESGDLLRALGQMQQALRGMVNRVRSASDSIGTASAEIATGNQDLSVRTEQTASKPAASGFVDGAADRHRASVGRLGTPREPARVVCGPGRRTRWRGRLAGRGHDGRHQHLVAQDRRHHRRDRRHRVPDQHPRVERSRRSGACRRTRPRLRGGRLGSSQPRATQRRSGQGDQGPHRRFGREGRRRLQARRRRGAAR